MPLSVLDILVVLVPLAIIVWISLKARAGVRGVSDFLSAGHKAGRYLISVADGAAALGLISVIAQFELHYKSGFAVGFWWNLITIVSLFLTLSGFVIYRYRQTGAMTMAQFYEMRYSRGMRIYAGFLAFISGLINYAIFPSVAARFFIYYCGLPFHFSCFGHNISMYGFLMALFLGIALFIVLLGGQITNMVSDCCQGLFGYIAYAVIVVIILSKFSMQEIGEAVLARPEGESFVNPFNVDRLTTFNLLFILISLVSLIYNRNAWLGNQGYMSSGASPHEQKMAGVLSVLRSGYLNLAMMLLVMGAYTFLNNSHFQNDADTVRQTLSQRTIQEFPICESGTGLSNNQDIIKTEKTRGTIYNQMLVPVTLRRILPPGVAGCFLALMLFLMISTDTTYMHSWGTILVQDVILSIWNRPISEKKRIMLIRMGIAFIAIFAWTFSFFFMQNDYILQFMALTATIYLGGAGSCMIGGLYWKRGTTWGAYTAMTLGCIIAVIGFFLNNKWGTLVYPWLAENYPIFLENFRLGLEKLGNALPFANWDTATEHFAKTFPITSKEIYLVGMVTAMIGYVIVSLVTGNGRTFDLDAMLHRTPTNANNKRGIWQTLIGIDQEYTKGDKIIAWSVFCYTMYNFAFFAVEAIWNAVPAWRWQETTWFAIWKYYTLPFTLCVGTITTIWFIWGGCRDLKKLFRNQ